MTTSDGPPPGWYDDGATPDVERWFDGRAWTEHTRPRPAPVPVTPPEPVRPGTTWAPAGGPGQRAAAAGLGTSATTSASTAASGGSAPAPGVPAGASGAGYAGSSHAGSSHAGSSHAGAAYPGATAHPGTGATAQPVAGAYPGAVAPVAVASPWNASSSTWGTGPVRAAAPPSTGAYPWAPVEYASWVRRVAACLVDSLVLVPWALAYAYAMLTATPGTDVYGAPALQPTPTGTGVLLVGVLVMWVLHIANRWVLPARTGQSLGKRALGIRLQSEETGTTFSVWTCLVRDFAHVLDSVVLYLGYLWPLWDAKRQTFADKAVKAVVLRDV